MNTNEDREQLTLAAPTFGDEAAEALKGVLASGRLTDGPQVAAFEEAIAALSGTAHAVACTSATTALQLVLAGLDLGAGAEVVVADFTYPATGNAVIQRGGRLVLAEIDPKTWCIDPDALEALISPATSAVIAVDPFGLPADYERLEALTEQHGIPLICDAACSLGGAIEDRRSGSFGRASCFSFHPRKSLTTGEGGMVTTDDRALAGRLRRLRNHGSRREGWRAVFLEPGFNFRMSELQAALGLVQIPSFEEIVKRRRELAAALSAMLEDMEDVTPQGVPRGHRHAYQSYVVRLDEVHDRDRVIEVLRGRRIESTLGTYALHAEPAFAEHCGMKPGDLPVSWSTTTQTLALPLHERLLESDLERVATELRAALRA